MTPSAAGDRRFEAVVLVANTADALPSTASALTALRDEGVAIAVIAPTPLRDLAALFAPGSLDVGTLLLGGDGGRERAVGEGNQLRALPPAPSHVDSAVLESLGRTVAARLAWLGFSAVAVPSESEGVATVSFDLTSGPSPTDGVANPDDLVSAAAAAARDAGLEDARVTIAGTRLTIGVTHSRAAVSWALGELWNCGIGPADVLIVKGPATAEMPDALTDQLRRRALRELPQHDPVPGWSLAIDGFDVEAVRVRSTLLALADGRLGSSGAPLADHPSARRWVLAMGVYQGDGPETHLLSAPVAFALPFELGPDTRLRRVLDLRTGVLHEQMTASEGTLPKIRRAGSSVPSSVSSIRFSSLVRPGTAVLRAACPDGRATTPLLPPADDAVLDEGSEGSARWMRVAATTGGVAAAVVETETSDDADRVLDRLAVYESDADHVPDPATVVAAATDRARWGFDRLLAEHRRAWAARWQDADIAIEGDDELQLATRFNLFHLMASVPDDDEAAVGARGLTGPGYGGHVFWDADTFVLPFVAATHPAAARAMLEYRIRRLDAARDIARTAGRAGARFPWESARTGRDVTPVSARDRTGRVVPIRTGQLEEHIVAQVPWAACCYIDWTGDEDFAYGAGLRLLVETARYWTSRIRVERNGTAHIYGVIGPDEYHEPVDDNAFTNVAARWNLRRAAESVEGAADARDVTGEEVEHWRRLADDLVDGYDPDTGIYEQFAGFSRLEPLIIEEVAPRRPIAADLLLGAERVHGAQVIKQADVLMLHHLLPAEVAPDSLEPNLRYYEPRTAHGSSLSPAIHAALFARARDYDHALESLLMATRIDLDDLTGTTAGGVHLATMGGVWQAFAYGFFGLRPREGRLAVDPRLPREWAALEIRVRFRGSRVRVRTEHGHLSIHADPPVGVLIDSSQFRAIPTGIEFERRGAAWRLLR